jgi:hypothetical protein
MSSSLQWAARCMLVRGIIIFFIVEIPILYLGDNRQYEMKLSMIDLVRCFYG